MDCADNGGPVCEMVRTVSRKRVGTVGRNSNPVAVARPESSLRKGGGVSITNQERVFQVDINWEEVERSVNSRRVDQDKPIQ